MIGTKLAHYEITSHLGTGGMGEVYQATDLKLGRSVAIKLLPEAFTHDHDRAARFEREARVLASLNHPSIATIHGVEESGGRKFLVMELVPGETLAKRIARGPIPIDESLNIARQIAEALEAAHEKGVLHRDLKPANIKVTPGGQVKVLDFGLAKVLEDRAADVNLSDSPTRSGTLGGVILGTAAYMSPEQARGMEVGRASDVWAFGCVLFEMLTGRQAFSGHTVTDILGAILKLEPDWHALPERTPAGIRKLLSRCLQKERKNRLHDIADARIEIEDALSEPQPASAYLPERKPTARRTATIGITAAIAGALLSLLAFRVIQREEPAAVRRLSVVTPNPIAFTGTPSVAIAISPDGNDLVYVGQNLEIRPSHPQLYLRSLKDLTVRPLPGTDYGVQPFFSPDGKWLAFFTFTGELKKLALAGGNPITLADHIDASRWSSGVYIDSETIVFGSAFGAGGISRISSSGGKPENLTSPDLGQHERRHSNPQILPGSHTALFDVNYENQRDPRIEALMLDSMQRKVIVEKASNPQYLASGHLLFKRDDVLMVARFDVKNLTLLGPGIPLVDKVRYAVRPQLVVSAGGTMAYIPVSAAALPSLGIIGVDGTFQPLAGLAPNSFYHPRLSVNGQFLTFETADGAVATDGAVAMKVQIYDLQRGTIAKLTQEGSDAVIAWHPNNREIAVDSIRQNTAGIFLKDLNGRERLLVPKEPNTTFRPGSWSPDGKLLAYVVQKGSTHDIWIVAEDGKSAPRPYLNTPASEYLPIFSPDGKWLAYVSNKSGRTEVYVRAFPDGDEIQVSPGGGNNPVWRPDGKEIFYSDPALPLAAVSLAVEGHGLRLGRPVKVLDRLTLDSSGGIGSFNFAGGWPGNEYDVFPDGKRFITTRSSDPLSREIVVVQNWFREFEEH